MMFARCHGRAARLSSPSAGPRSRPPTRPAVTFLTSLQESPEGLRDFFKVLESQNLRISGGGSVYARTHPLTQDRIRFMNEQVERSPYRSQHITGDLVEAHERMVAKLDGFLSNSAGRAAPAHRRQRRRSLCARRRPVSCTRHRRLARHDRRPDRQRAEESVFPRAQGPDSVRERQGRPQRCRPIARRCATARPRR